LVCFGEEFICSRSDETRAKKKPRQLTVAQFPVLNDGPINQNISIPPHVGCQHSFNPISAWRRPFLGRILML